MLCSQRVVCVVVAMIGLVLPELPVLVHLGVGPGTDPPQERLIGNESIVVSGSQHSLIRMSTSSRSSFSPRESRMCSSSPNIMVPFSILSQSFKHSTKSSKLPVSFDFLTSL